MRIGLIALLFGLLATADAFSVSKNVKITTQTVAALPRSLTVDQRVIPLKRLLRTAKTNEDDEERGPFGIPAIDNLIDNIGVQIALMSKETGVDKAFKLLKLDGAGENLLQNAQFTTWEKYVKMVKPNDVDDSIVSSIRRHYGDDVVSKILAAAEKTPATSELAKTYEAVRLKGWISYNLPPDEVLGMLKLDKAVKKMFDSPQLETFTKYVEMFNKKNPREKTNMLTVFTKKYDGSDVILKMLLSAEDSNSPGATKLKNEMVKNWLDGHEHPANVFKILKLDEAGDNLLSSPLLSTWVQYMKKFNEQNPHGETTMIKTFSKSYDDDKLAAVLEAAKKVPDTEQLAKNLQTAQFNQWIVEKKTPKEMLSVLKLNSQNFNDNNPTVDIWRAYNKAYVKKADTGFAFQP